MKIIVPTKADLKKVGGKVALTQNSVGGCGCTSCECR